ncbi:MAG: ABC transporter permease subunit [Candidatus Hydrogenedentota bacterium]
MRSITNIFSLSKIIFIYWKRNKIFYGFIIAGILFIALSVISTLLGPRIKERILIDMGFASIELIGWISIIFIGAVTIIKNIDNKSIYFYLSKPLSRNELLLGTYLGLCYVLVSLYLLFCFIYFIFLFIVGVKVTSEILLVFFYLFLKLSVILTVGFFFSSYSTSMIASILLTFSSIIIGYLTHGIDYYIRLAEPPLILRFIYKFIQIIFPYMEHYNIIDYLLEVGISNTGLHTLGVTLYTLGYIIFIIGISSRIFSKRDL